MVCPVLITADELLQYPVAQVGSRAATFGALFAEGIPIPPLVVVPRETLARLGREVALLEFLEQVVSQHQHTDAHSKQHLKQTLTNFITRIRLPEWFTTELVRVFEQQFNDSFVTLQLSDPLFGHDESRFSQVTGEANLCESFLDLWAHSIELLVLSGKKPDTNWLAPSPICLLAQYQPVVSGVGFTHNPEHASKQQLLLHAIWGTPDPSLLDEAADSFSVDIRTWNIVHREIATKTKQYQRVTDERISIPVPHKYQQYPTLTDTQAAAIAQIIFAIKQKRLHHFRVTWELAPQGIYVTGMQEHTPESQRIIPLKKSVTKLYVSTGNPYKHRPHLTGAVDGIGVLRSEYTYLKYGTHPLHAITTKQTKRLTEELLKTIHTYREALPFQPILYRSQNCTTAELRQLQHADRYVPHEPNPYIGFRGGFQLIQQPAFLDFELDIIAQALRNSSAPLGYLVPFVRSPHELEHIAKQCSAHKLFAHQQFGLWLQINTPENILGLRSYPLQHLAGIVLNVRSVQALLKGVDPDVPELYSHYATETLALEQLMEQLVQTLRRLQEDTGTLQQPKILLHLEDFSHELVARAVKLGYDGIIVKPATVPIAHTALLEIEQAQLAATV